MNEGKRPTLWIALTCVFAAAAVGLGIWAFSAQSDADDAKADLEQAAAAVTETPEAAPTEEATPAPAPTEAPEAAPVPTTDPAVEQAYEDVKDQLGAISESAEQLQSELDQAQANVTKAEQAKADAQGLAEELRADVENFRAQAELTKTCLKGSISALGDAFSAGGTQAAVDKLKTLAGKCRAD
jgi:chromosome segregation ATPase